MGYGNNFDEKINNMKKTTLILLTLAIIATGLAQNETGKSVDSGKITYVEKVKIEIKTIDGVSDETMASFPKERASQKILYFTSEYSLYVNEKKNTSEDVVNEENGGAMVKIRMVEPDDKYFCDLKSKKRLEQKEFMSRIFLIESDMSTAQWKLTGNRKTILNYPCQEAVLQDTSKKISAWFTPMIPVASGPGIYGNLPGLILAIDINDGERTITAISIDETTPDKNSMAKPKEGKKVTQEQFAKIRDEKMKEMGAEGGGSGTQMIIKIEK